MGKSNKIFVIMSWLSAIIVLSVLVFVCFSVWCMNSFPVSQTELNRIEIGMTMQEVRGILGEPKYIEDNYGYEEWRYSKPLMWTMVYVSFSKESVVDEIVVDR